MTLLAARCPNPKLIIRDDKTLVYPTLQQNDGV